MSGVAQQALLMAEAIPPANVAFISGLGWGSGGAGGPSPTVGPFAIGATAGPKLVVIGLSWVTDSAGTATLTSATIGGVTATIIGQIARQVSSVVPNWIQSALISAVIPAATSTVNATMNFSRTNQGRASCWSLTNLLSTGPTDSRQDSFAPGGGGTYNGSLNVINGGVVVLASETASDATGYNVGGFTKDDFGTFFSTASLNYDWLEGSGAIGASNTAYNLSLTRTGGGGSGFEGAICSASFR